MIENPVHQVGGRYRPYAGRHEALAIGHHLFYWLGLQQHTDNPAVTEYGCQVVELALRTLQRAKEDKMLDHTDEYVAPKQHHRGRPVARGRGRARARTSPRGRAVPRGRQDEPSSNMPSYSLQLELPASQVTPSDPLMITGTFDGDVEQFFSGPSIAAEDRPTLDMDGEHKLSFGSSPAVAADLSQAQVADGPTTPSIDPAISTDDQTVAHPHIKRRRDEDDLIVYPSDRGCASDLVLEAAEANPGSKFYDSTTSKVLDSDESDGAALHLSSFKGRRKGAPLLKILQNHGLALKVLDSRDALLSLIEFLREFVTFRFRIKIP
uniref:Uncharacterized protein LOC104237042 n=1 Tax=Nicotiana sylvestris TaxID=4096 RepID=A0A1U7XSE4_NICSY|nr:PREDICTED: uncharacterized protein LOC104237042 [Nicotiana sylvestris]